MDDDEVPDYGPEDDAEFLGYGPEPEDDDMIPSSPSSYSDPHGIDEMNGMTLEGLQEHFDLADAGLGTEENDVELQEVWDSVPEDIMWNILMRLPVAAQCRFRCVCSRWRDLLSAHSSPGRDGIQVESRPLYAIMANTTNSKCSFYSHAEKKWYRIPFQAKSCLDVDWTLRDTDGGLLCYEAYVEGISWLLVCNPITGSFQLVPPNYPNLESAFWPPRIVDFSVDLRAKSFKIVMMHESMTLIFYSKTQEWKVLEKQPPTAAGGCRDFVWKNRIYSPTREPSTYLVFDMESGLWSTVEVDIPGEVKDLCYQIVKSKGQVMIIAYNYTHEEPVRVWVLLDARDAPTLSLSKWERVPVQIPVSVRPLVSQFQACWSYGKEFMFFGTQWTHHWMKYSFRTKTWDVMPRSGRMRPPSYYPDPGMYIWFNWEPRIDMHVEYVAFNISKHPEIAESRRRRGHYWYEFNPRTDEFLGVDYSDYSDDADMDVYISCPDEVTGADLSDGSIDSDGASDHDF